MTVQPSDFQIGILKVTEFIFKDVNHFLIVAVILLIISWMLMAYFLSLDDMAWRFLTFFMMVFLIVGFLFMVEKGLVEINLETIGNVGKQAYNVVF